MMQIFFSPPLALLGSYATGTARPDSDIDMLMLTPEPAPFRTNTTWLDEIKRPASLSVNRWQDEDYGRVWSRRLWLGQDRRELEISFGSLSWADINPIDPGTIKIITAGLAILYDPQGLLKRLCIALAN